MDEQKAEPINRWIGFRAKIEEGEAREFNEWVADNNITVQKAQWLARMHPESDYIEIILLRHAWQERDIRRNLEESKEARIWPTA